ncbi:protein ACCELERATED CELL DEATH 6-like [Syzygium oleosum]|uniref:protein ACCELERATED CELL DEATH 6-like n=1 Tax=Syzygium oleosum TaxID=219896 RepID=UPI0024B9EDCD|nr:protein ACCELERATED CELL DEATH 6-like [Syzygium oleosum]
MDVKLSIGEEEVGMDASIQELVQKDEGGASLNMLDDGMDSMEEEKTAQTAEQQDPAEVYAAARKLADVIEGANVEDIISTIETLAHQTHSSAIFNFRGLPRGSLLHIAAATGKSDILRLLLDHVDAHLIAAQDDWGNTPLHIATKAKALGVTGMLIHRARDLPNGKNILRIKNKHGNTALHEAVLTRDVGLVSHLLREDLEPMYWKNVHQKSPLYLALETDNSEILEVLISNSLEPSRIEGLPPVQGAIVRRNYGLAARILKKDVKLFAMTDSSGGNVFHLAACMNRHRQWEPLRPRTNHARLFELIRPETEYLARERDTSGDLPIHIASKMGYVDLIEKLLPVSPLLNGQGQTVLHVAAKYGRTQALRYILRHPKLGMLINESDHAGNTALHLAAMHSQPTTLIPLVLDERISLNHLNHECMTALDIALDRGSSTFRQFLAYVLLVSTSAVSMDILVLRPEARNEAFSIVQSREKKLDLDLVKEVINCRLVVATLVATVTFAAGFAVPGGFNGTDAASRDYRGIATMLDNRMFQAFAICNTVAMFCSITSVINLIWAQTKDIDLVRSALSNSEALLTIALPAMSVAFLTGVISTLGKLPWLANTIFYLGLVFVLIITVAILSRYFFFSRRNLRLIRLLLSWNIRASIYFWRVKAYILDDSEEDGKASSTTASQPPNGAGESHADDSTTAKCGDTPHPPNL